MNLETVFGTRFSLQDIDRELKKMPELARAKAASLPDEAEQTFERLLSERLGDLHVHVQSQADAEAEY